jgi:hypothetical protein
MSTSLHLPPGPPTGPAAPAPNRRGPRVAAALVAAALLATGAGVLFGFAGGASHDRPAAGAGPVPTPLGGASASGSTGAGPTRTGSTDAGAPVADPPAPPAGRPALASAQWLWPFTGEGEVTAWQRAFRDDGHQPWHLDAAATAVGFAGYLGYTGIDRALRSNVDGDDAHVVVGFRLPDGRPHAAADLHLVRVGAGRDAPWEVAGTRDSTLTLTRPGYGSTVTSPMTVGGRITGVDERVVVTLHTRTGDLQAAAPSVAAGGQRSRWSVPVAFRAARGTVLTVAAATGGHVAPVERFAVTGVRVGAPAGPRPPVTVDVDGDGREDAVGIAAPGTLVVRYGGGGAEQVSFEAQSGDGRLHGVADADRDGRDEVFVHVGTGAYTDQTSVFRYVGGRLRLVTLDGRQVWLMSGSSVRSSTSWACRPAAAALVQWVGSSTDSRTYTGTLVSYRFSGAAVVQVARRSLTVDGETRPPSGCGEMPT